MKSWRFVMTVIAGLGLFIGICATAYMAYRAYADFKLIFIRPPMFIYIDWPGQPFIFMLYLLGLALASIGGLIGRPRYSWLLFIATGAAYVISTCIVMLAEQHIAMLAEHRWEGVISITLGTLLISSPGIVFIIEGLVIRHLRKRDDLVVGV